MKRRIIVLLFLVNIIICVCSCKIQTDNDDITPVRTGLKFEDVVDMCSSVIGLDISSYCENKEDNCHFEYEDYRIHYVRDYAAQLEDIARENDDGLNLYNPSESEYHIVSLLSINGCKVFVFDSQEWALTDFCSVEDELVDYEPVVSEGSYEDGYCFISYKVNQSERISMFYYLDDMVVIYTYNYLVDDIDDYQQYLDFCEALGLPTSDQITEEVMASAP